MCKCKYAWSELNHKRTVTKVVCSKRATFQFCSGLWDLYFPSRFQVHSHPKGTEKKTAEHKLRSSVNWQGALKQKGIKEMGIKRGLGV